MMPRRLLFVVTLALPLGVTFACTHDFDRFEGGAGQSTSDVSTEASPGPDARSPTDASADAIVDAPREARSCEICGTERTRCRETCDAAEDACEDACSNFQCRIECRNKRDRCRQDCAAACRTCAGSGDRCEDACD